MQLALPEGFSSIIIPEMDFLVWIGYPQILYLNQVFRQSLPKGHFRFMFSMGPGVNMESHEDEE
eukprot:12146360-Ditylum_brightwellii.AAC.1